MLRRLPRAFWVVALMLFALRLGLLWHNNPGLELNWDEVRNARIADNWLQGKGYVSFDQVRQQLRPDAFHATFPVWVYAAWAWVGLPRYYLVALLMLPMAAGGVVTWLYAQRILRWYQLPPRWAWLGGGALALYPSVLWYVGAWFWYENLCLPALVWVTHQLLRLQAGRPLPAAKALLLALVVVVSCLLRGYLLALYGLMFAWVLWRGYRAGPALLRRVWRPALLTLVLTVGLHLPILVKNQRLFGAYILSTQAGFELLQGHNSATEGKFMFNWDEADKPFGRWVQQSIPNLLALDQYQESQARARLARQWVAAHPAHELRLLGRKLLVFFSPENFVADAYRTAANPITAAVHLGFLLSLLLTAVGWRGLRFRAADVLLLTPFAVVLLLSLVFFVGYRWRLFAEPAFVLFPLITIWRLGQAPAAKQPPST
ncbi:hypothetical protein D3Y59_13995 [Hymenobacter oligotrophus]|uniref:Glycosyltransferase RgtA/B/C/D-like domain-containing protein n=1 Tax=Hymenobacter oligotrophus TaxID=2319843 RepID=A0A3B7R2R8_9BACT|nr:hypothetical protein [Hymenobacter oligotrophus]AYA38052.1 hypothetical protein D3Y59_13995 [Hymenobacter oligotrophus]